MKRSSLFILFSVLSLLTQAQKKNSFGLNLAFGNTMYYFDPEKIRSIFIDDYEPGAHNLNPGFYAIEFQYDRKLMNRVWLANSTGINYQHLSYTDRASKKPKTHFSSSEVFIPLRSGLRIYSNEYVSPVIFLELQAGFMYSLSGGSGFTDYVKGDFYKPGSLTPCFHAGIGIRRIIIFYTQMLARDMAADKLKTIGICISAGT